MHLNEARVSGHGLQVLEDGVEALYVPDLQDALLLLGELDQLGGLGRLIGHGLLDQHMAPLLQERLGQLKVRRGGSNNAHGIARGRRLGH